MFWRCLSVASFGLLMVGHVPQLQAAELFRPLCIKGECVKWLGASNSEPLVLTWSIARRTVSTSDAFNCRELNPPDRLLQHSQLSFSAYRQALYSAFAIWQHAANIVFVETTDQDRADIVIGDQVVPSGYAFTNVTLTREVGRSPAIEKALICLNPARRWKVGFDGNLVVYDLVRTFAHEIGHAIGLDHPDGRGHVMSFRYDEARSGLSEGDVQGAIALYGRPPQGAPVFKAGARPQRVIDAPFAVPPAP